MQEEHFQKGNSAGLAIFSVDNTTVYVALFHKKEGRWTLPQEATGDISEERSRLLESVNSSVTLNLSPEALKVELGYFSISENLNALNTQTEKKEEHGTKFFFTQTEHTPLALVKSDLFDGVKWFTLDEAKTIPDTEEGVADVIEKASTYVTLKDTSGTKRLVLVGAVSLLMVGVLSFVLYRTLEGNKRRLTEREEKTSDAYTESLLKNNPKALQESFVNDLKNGVNDKYTKSSAYFITHRYFDNGGNIYEIIDYIKTHPELSFLKEAGNIYPELATRIKNKELPTTHSDSGMYAMLALIEVLDNHGYSDIASLGTLANQYAKLAYFMKRVAKETPMTPVVEERLKYVQRDIDKSLLYQEKTKQEVLRFFSGELTDKDVPARDILVGLNQYAATLRYLELLQVPFNSPKTSKEVFAASVEYSANKVPELYAFTSFLDASTLALSASTTDPEVQEAIQPFLRYAQHLSVNQATSTNLINKVIKAKNETIKIPQDINFDIYGKTSVVLLAKRSSDFKKWLLANGWSDSDFTTPVKILNVK